MSRKELNYCCFSIVFVLVLGFAPVASGTTFTDQTAALLSPEETILGDGVVAFADYDRDGWVDVLTGQGLWHNDQGTHFTLVTPSIYGYWADCDNDGYPDIFTPPPAPDWDLGVVSINEKQNWVGQVFVAKSLPEMPTQTNNRGTCWGDFDGDAFVDLYIGAAWDNTFPASTSGLEDKIYTNDGNANDPNFALTWQEPLTSGVWFIGRGVTACDFDEDADLDIYVSNYFQMPNYLWQNDGNGIFTDVAATYGVAGDFDGWLASHGHTIGSAWGDLDNDGHIDLFVGNLSHAAADNDRCKFYRNMGPAGSYHFEDKSSTAGLTRVESFASPALGDYDNDGDLDLFLTAVGGTGYPGDVSVLYDNDGSWAFTQVLPASSGLGGLDDYQAAWADVDNDGWLDLITGGKIFINEGGSNHWLKVILQGYGTTINASAIGAQVRITAGVSGIGIPTRQVEAGTGESNQNDLTLHFGLGTNTGPLTLEVSWPDGTTQIVSDVAVDQTIVVPKIRADFDGDGTVDLLDFATLADLWQEDTLPW